MLRIFNSKRRIVIISAATVVVAALIGAFSLTRNHKPPEPNFIAYTPTASQTDMAVTYTYVDAKKMPPNQGKDYAISVVLELKDTGQIAEWQAGDSSDSCADAPTDSKCTKGKTPKEQSYTVTRAKSSSTVDWVKSGTFIRIMLDKMPDGFNGQAIEQYIDSFQPLNTHGLPVKVRQQLNV
jgi:hypothetical protein